MKKRRPTPTAKSHPKSKATQETPAAAARAERVITARSVDARLQLYYEFFAEQRKNRNPQARYATYERLAEVIGTSVSSVRRDVQHLRDRRRWPLDFIPERNGWGFTEDVTALPGSHFTEGELTAICLAMRALEGIQRIAFHGKVREAVEKIIIALRSEVKVDLPALEKAVSFRTIGLDAFVDPQSFEVVMEAILNGEELDIDYAKLNWPDEAPSSSASLSSSASPAPLQSAPAPQKRPRQAKLKPAPKPPIQPVPLSPDHPAAERVERRRVEPLHLLCMDQVWYLFAYDPMRDAIRSFALTRMRDVRRSGRPFEPRAFDLDEHLAPSFGITSGKPVNVRVRFRGKPARLVCERLWHPSQELVPHADGSVDIRLHVAITPELQRWVLGWGSSAEVLQPRKLRDAIQDAARGILTNG